MDPLKHFLHNRRFSRDIWSFDKIAPCASCKIEATRDSKKQYMFPSEMLFKTTEFVPPTPKPSHTPRTRIAPTYTGPSARRRQKTVSTPAPSVDTPTEAFISGSPVDLCSNCYRDLPSQRLIRGESPQYEPRFLSDEFIENLAPITPPIREAAPILSPMPETPPITPEQKHKMQKAFAKKYGMYWNDGKLY